MTWNTAAMRRHRQFESRSGAAAPGRRRLRRGTRALALGLAGALFAGPMMTSAPAGAQDPRAAVAGSVQRAERALAAGEVEVAESALRDAVREGWSLIGNVQLASPGAPERLDAAAASFDRARRVSTRLRAPSLSLARVLVQRGGDGDFDAAKALLRDLISRTPRDGESRRLLAQTLVSSGDTEAAVLVLEEGWSFDADGAAGARPGADLETAFALATGYLRLQKLDRAAPLFTIVAERRPIAETRVLIGRMYRDFGHLEAATRWLEEALDMKADVRRARYYLGTVVLLRLGMDGLEPAIAHFEAELKLAPDDPMTQLYLGSALVEDRQLERSLPLLDEAAGWAPVAFDAERYKGRALLSLGRPEEAVSWLERAFEKSAAASSRDLAEMHYQLGSALRQLGRGDDAKHHFARAKDLGRELAAEQREKFESFVRDEVSRSGDEAVDPLRDGAVGGAFAGLGAEQRSELEASTRLMTARASMNLGVLDARAGRFERAALHFEEARAAEPTLPDLDRSLAMAQYQAGRHADAIPALLRAEGAASGDARTALRRTLALAHLNVGADADAVRLLADDPDRPTTPALQMAYAVALVRSDRAAEAAPLFDQLLSVGEEWPALHVALGQARAHEGDWNAAEASLRRALELDPDVADARESLGEIYLRQGELDAAVDVLEGELERRPDHVNARYLLATALDLNGRSVNAVGHLELLLASVPRHGDGRYLLGKILLAEGDASAAIEQLEAAKALSPEDANVHYQLGQAHQRRGDRESAQGYFESFRRLKAEQRGEAP
ncbi:MAG: tetratricopeptide repeat protein [Acidobacteriota bacterium]